MSPGRADPSAEHAPLLGGAPVRPAEGRAWALKGDPADVWAGVSEHLCIRQGNLLKEGRLGGSPE